MCVALSPEGRGVSAFFSSGMNGMKQAGTGIGVAPAIPRRKVGCLGECAVVLPALSGADFRRVTLDHGLCPAIMWCEKRKIAPRSWGFADIAEDWPVQSGRLKPQTQIERG